MTERARRPLVVDASVAVKWVVAEPFYDVAIRLYRDSTAAGQPPFAPSLLPNEVTNAIFRQLRRGLLTEHRADIAVARFTDLDVQLVAPSDLPAKAYAFAKRHQLGAIYDALYVVLARDLGADLWTDDRTLLNTLGSTALWVRWIGDYPATA